MFPQKTVPHSLRALLIQIGVKLHHRLYLSHMCLRALLIQIGVKLAFIDVQ